MLHSTWHDQYISSSTYFRIKQIGQIVVDVWLILLLYLMIYARCCTTDKFKSFTNRKSRTHKLVLLSDGLTISMLIMYIINGASTTCNVWMLIPFNNNNIITCNLLIKFQWISLQYCRVLLYLVIITRINLAFHNSVYSYSNIFMYFLYLIICIFIIIFTFLDIKYLQSDIDDKHKHFCITIFPSGLVFAALLFDIGFTLLCLYLFILPLMKIVRKMNRYDIASLNEEDTFDQTEYSNCEYNEYHIFDSAIKLKNNKNKTKQSFYGDDHNFIHLVVKYTNITTICMISTTLGLGLVLINQMTIFLTFDNALISLSVVLMCKDYQSLYYKLLGCCHKQWMKCCQKLCINRNVSSNVLFHTTDAE